MAVSRLGLSEALKSVSVGTMAGRRPAHVSNDVTRIPGDVTRRVADDVTCRPFRVRPEAVRIWQQHTGGTVGQLLGQAPPPVRGEAAEARTARAEATGNPTAAGAEATGNPAAARTAGVAEPLSARERLRTNRSMGRRSGGARQPMRALPINGVTEEALSCSKTSSSAGSFLTSPVSPRRHIDLDQLAAGDLAAVEGVRGVRVIAPGRQRAAHPQNGGFPSHGEGIPSGDGGFPSHGEGIPSGDEGIPSPRRFRRVPSCGDLDSGSVSPRLTRASSAVDLDDRLPVCGPSTRRANHSDTAGNSRGRPAALTNGEGVPSQHHHVEGIPSPQHIGEGIHSLSAAAAGSWRGGDVARGGDSDAADGRAGRVVRLNVPAGDSADRVTSDRSASDCDLRRERIRALIGSLRGPPTDGSARAAAGLASTSTLASRSSVSTTAAAAVTGTGRGTISEPPIARFSSESRLSFREQALERSRAPYRAPSIAASRKFKSSEALRDGARVPPPPDPAAGGPLSRRKSRSVARLTRHVDNVGLVDVNHGALATGTTHPVRAAPPPPVAKSNCKPSPHDSPVEPQHQHNATRDNYKPASHEPSETAKDFVRLNRQLASQRTRRARSQPRSREQTAAAQTETTLPGQLPRYLLRRQQEWRDEERRRLEAAPDPACPPGHTRMADGERLQTLHVLTDNHGALLTELRGLPIAHSSSRLTSQRADLERQLQKLEEGIRIFSRPKVFVRNDS